MALCRSFAQRSHVCAAEGLTYAHERLRSVHERLRSVHAKGNSDSSWSRCRDSSRPQSRCRDGSRPQSRPSQLSSRRCRRHVTRPKPSRVSSFVLVDNLTLPPLLPHTHAQTRANTRHVHGLSVLMCFPSLSLSPSPLTESKKRVRAQKEGAISPDFARTTSRVPS